MTETISGFWTAIATPLRQDGAIDTEAFVEHAQWLLLQGCDGLVLFGTTGEGTSFSARERLDTVAALQKAGISPDRLALGTGFPALPDSIALTRDALALGLRHVLALPPYFYRDVDAAGLAASFSALIDGVADDRVRVTLYHIPQVSGVAIPAALPGQLRTRYGAMVAGVKDSSGEFAQFRAFRAASPDVAVTVGSEADIARALAEGGAGTICGMANIVPDRVKAMFAGPDGEPAMREALALMTGPFLPTLKTALAALTGQPGWRRVRPPLRAADAAQGLAMAAALGQGRRAA